jgi:hypothetical protein
MANQLPPGAIPKLWRGRNKEGKEVGAWYIHIKKKPVNLRTQDYTKARERAREALAGKRDFVDERYFEESVPEETSTSQRQIAAIPETPETTQGAGDWASDAQRAASAGTTAVKLDEYIPPPPKDEPITAKPIPTPGAADSTNLPPELMEGLIKQIAHTLVELQIHCQEYLAIRFGKFQPGEVPLESDARKIPAAIWESAVRKMIPTDVPLPEWLVAPLLVAMLAGTLQLEGATPLRKEDVPPS